MVGRWARAKSGRIVIPAVLLAFLAILAPVRAKADHDYATLDPTASLPEGRYGAGAVWTGDAALLFGGRTDGGCDGAVIRFDPEANEATLVGSIGMPIAFASVIWTGSYAYIFGGELCDGTPTDQILRYDVQSGVTMLMASRLSEAISRSSAVWAGDAAYIFSGRTAQGSAARWIQRYDPATDSIQPNFRDLGSNGFWDSAAVWDGHAGYVFVGRDAFSSYGIVRRFEPESSSPGMPTVAYIGSSGFAGLSAIWEGTSAYTFGGNTYGSSDIQYFVPGQSRTTSTRTAFPSVHEYTAAVWTGSAAYIFGGTYADGGTAYSDIIRYAPAPSHPSNLQGAFDSGARSISLTWDVGTATAPLKGYRVYAVKAGYEYHRVLLAELGDVRSFTDQTLSPGVHSYAIAAWNDYGESSLSNTVSIEVPFAVPSAPQNLVATPTSFNYVTLSWSPPAFTGGQLSGYRLYRRIDDSGWSFLKSLEGDDTSAFDSGEARALHSYRLVPFNSGGEGIAAETAVRIVGRPGMPTNFEGRPGDLPTQIKLSWSPPADDGGMLVDTYIVYGTRADYPTGYPDHMRELGRVHGTTFTDSGLFPLTEYRYVVAALTLDEGERADACSLAAPALGYSC